MLDKKLHDNKLKIASAIGKIKSTGVEISAPDVNASGFTFSPDVEHNTIRYGLSGITRISADLIKNIIASRPYSGINDFIDRIKVTKPQMINLIKAGAFDSFGDRLQLMKGYISMVSEPKKRMTLQNLNMLINFGFIPDEYDMVRRIFNFNKYLKKLKLDASYFGLDRIAFSFYEKYCDLDKLKISEETESGFKISIATWKTIYDKYMDKIRPFIQKNNKELLTAVNDKLFKDVWNKYCEGSISKWEMDSVSCYMHPHELSTIKMYENNLSNFFKLSETPRIDRFIPIKGKNIPIYCLDRIAGTVLDRDKNKKTVTLLTTEGVVTVKIYGGVFQVYDKQISEKGPDGKKHVIEKSAFQRGNKIIVTGVRDGDAFLAKTYTKTPWHKVEIIDTINIDGTFTTRERLEME